MGPSNEKNKALSWWLTEALTILCVETDNVTCHERHFPKVSFTITWSDLKRPQLLLHPCVWEKTACSVTVLVGQRSLKPYAWQASFSIEIYFFTFHIYVLYIAQKYIFHFNICLNLYLFIIFPSWRRKQHKKNRRELAMCLLAFLHSKEVVQKSTIPWHFK